MSPAHTFSHTEEQHFEPRHLEKSELTGQWMCYSYITHQYRITGTTKTNGLLKTSWRGKKTYFSICDFKQWLSMSEKLENTAVFFSSVYILYIFLHRCT